MPHRSSITRGRELYKQGAVSAKDVDDANVALIQARNVYEASQKQLDLKMAEGQFAAAKGQSTEDEVACELFQNRESY